MIPRLDLVLATSLAQTTSCSGAVVMMQPAQHGCRVDTAWVRADPDYYYNQIKSWFDPCVTYSRTHPFELTIQPDTAKYCG